MKPTEDEPTVTIPADLYDSLIRDSRLLECLEVAGVDNTDAYSFGYGKFLKKFPEYC